MSFEGPMPSEVVESVGAKTPVEAIKKRIRELSQNGAGYDAIKNITHELATAFDESEPSNPDDLRHFASAAQAVDEIRKHFFKRTGGSIDRMDELFPDRGEIYRMLMRVQYKAFDRIPFEELSDEEREAYIKSMVEVHGEHYEGYRNGYYYFGWPGFSSEKPKYRKLLEAIVKDKEKELTGDETEDVYRGERDTYKIHLNVPPDRKIEVLKAILAAQEKDNQIVYEILDQKREAGEEVSASRREIQEKGGRLASVNQYKMSKVGFDDHSFPDFVFYPRPVQGQTAKEALVEMAHEISSLLADLNLPPVDRIPRFSIPVVIGGEKIPGMTFTQGNGDFKAYLLAKHGEGRLSQYYDEERNWAVRKGEEVGFDKD